MTRADRRAWMSCDHVSPSQFVIRRASAGDPRDGIVMTAAFGVGDEVVEFRPHDDSDDPRVLDVRLTDLLGTDIARQYDVITMPEVRVIAARSGDGGVEELGVDLVATTIALSLCRGGHVVDIHAPPGGPTVIVKPRSRTIDLQRALTGMEIQERNAREAWPECAVLVCSARCSARGLRSLLERFAAGGGRRARAFLCAHERDLHAPESDFVRASNASKLRPGSLRFDDALRAHLARLAKTLRAATGAPPVLIVWNSLAELGRRLQRQTPSMMNMELGAAKGA